MRKFWFMQLGLGVGKLLLVPVVQSLGRNPPCDSRHRSLVPEMAWSWHGAERVAPGHGGCCCTGRPKPGVPRESERFGVIGMENIGAVGCDGWRK